MYLRQRVNAYVCVCLCTYSEHFSWQWNGNFQQVNAVEMADVPWPCLNTVDIVVGTMKH